MRLLVDESATWLTPDGAFALCDKALAGGYTDLAVSVWHGSGPRWFTDYDGLAWESVAPKPHYDPFGVLLNYAMHRGLRVWASFTCGIQQLPSIHPEWTYIQATQWTRYFNWMLPEFRAWMAGLVADCFKKHPQTPGLFVDYMRFWDGGPVPGDTDSRVAAVTDGLTAIVTAVRQINPAVLSMSFSNLDGSYYTGHRAVGNDGRLWYQRGLVQHMQTPAYQPDPRPRFQQIAAGITDLPVGPAVPILATYGSGLTARTPGDLLSCTEAQRDLFPHVAHYYTQTLTPQAVACLGAI